MCPVNCMGLVQDHRWHSRVSFKHFQRQSTIGWRMARRCFWTSKARCTVLYLEMGENLIMCFSDFSDKYNISEDRKSLYERVMSLTIRNWEKSDEGHFMCMSTNSLGEADGTIQSYSKIAQARHFLKTIHWFRGGGTLGISRLCRGINITFRGWSLFSRNLDVCTSSASGLDLRRHLPNLHNCLSLNLVHWTNVPRTRGTERKGSMGKRERTTKQMKERELVLGRHLETWRWWRRRMHYWNREESRIPSRRRKTSGMPKTNGYFPNGTTKSGSFMDLKGERVSSHIRVKKLRSDKWKV